MNFITKAKILVGAFIASTLSSQAVVLYTNTFDSSFDFTNRNTTELGGAAPDVVAEDFFGARNGVDISAGALNFTDGGANRGRGAAVWLNTSSWQLGTITVEFDISGFTSGGANSSAYYQAYSASGVDATNAVGVDIHSGSLDPTFSGSATAAAIGAQNAITANGSFSYTFNNTGAEQFIGLFFHNKSGASPSTQSEFSVDNLVVSDAIPEPTSAALLGLGSLAILLRRRR